MTVITVRYISAVIVKSVKHVGLKCLFLFSFELLDRNRHFGGNLLAHIFTKLKICSKGVNKIINIIACNYFTIFKVIKEVWFSEPINLMNNHA